MEAVRASEATTGAAGSVKHEQIVHVNLETSPAIRICVVAANTNQTHNCWAPQMCIHAEGLACEMCEEEAATLARLHIGCISIYLHAYDMQPPYNVLNYQPVLQFVIENLHIRSINTYRNVALSPNICTHMQP